nr:ribonuclease H-like domain-containing protein [Tanacetum cinerariifolium]
LSSSALEMLVPGYAVGKVMGIGRANVDNIHERLRQERNLAYLSKWLRNSIRQYDDFGQSLKGLKSFFRDIKEPMVFAHVILIIDLNQIVIFCLGDVVPGHAVGKVMGRGQANVDNIRKYDQDYFPGKKKRGKDYKEGMYELPFYYPGQTFDELQSFVQLVLFVYNSRYINAVVFEYKLELKSFLLAIDQNTTVFKEVTIIRHPRLEEYTFGFITSSLVLQVNKSSAGEASTSAASPKCCLSNLLVLKEISHYCFRTRMIYAASVYFMLLMQDLMLPVVILYVNAAIDTTAIGSKRRSLGFIFTMTACTLGLGPGCIFTLTAIVKWECSSYGRALALHTRGMGFDSPHFLIFSLFTAAPSISAASSKATISTLPNVDSLNDVVIYSFFAKLHSHEFDNRVSKNLENDRYKTGEWYHVVPPPYTGTFLPPKPDLVFTDDLTASKSVANVFNIESNETEIESVPKQREPSFVTSTEHVKSPRESVKKVKHHKQSANHRTTNQKSRGHKTNWNNKACFVYGSLNHLIKDCDYYENQMVQKSVWNNAMRIQVSIGLGPQKKLSFLFDVQANPQQALKDKGVIDSGCSRHMNGNISFLSNFEEINEGYVALEGILKVLPDENHVLLRVPRENNMYNVNLKNVVPSGGLTCLFTKATLDESNLWHRRLGHINFKTIDKLVKGNLVKGRSPSIGFMSPFRCLVTILNTLDPVEKFNEKANEGFLVGYFINSKAFKVFSSRTRIVQETLHINFLENKPNVIGIGPKWLFDIDSLTMSMNYQPVVAWNQPNDNAADDVADAAFDVKENENDVHISANGSDNTNRVNAVSALVNAVKPNSTNSTNTFNTASPSVNAISPNFGIVGKSSFVDPSQYPDDPDMLELEDIVYSDDKEEVGAEADLSNLETNIPIIIDLEDEVVNLLEKEKVNLETIESLKSKGVESSETVISKSKNQNENDCHKIEKVCDKEENPK